MKKCLMMSLVAICLVMAGCSSSPKGHPTPTPTGRAGVPTAFSGPAVSSFPTAIEVTWADGTKDSVSGSSGANKSEVYTFLSKDEDVRIQGNLNNGYGNVLIAVNGKSIFPLPQCEPGRFDMSLSAHWFPAGATITVTISPECN